MGVLIADWFLRGEVRECADCGVPLAPWHHGNRRLCDECAPPGRRRWKRAYDRARYRKRLTRSAR